MNNIILKVQGSEINSIINNQITVGEIVKVHPHDGLFLVKNLINNEVKLDTIKPLIFTEEKKFSFDSEHNTIALNKKFLIDGKVSLNQRVLIGGVLYKVIEIKKLEKKRKELVLEKISIKVTNEVFPVKKTYLNERNRIGQFRTELVEFYIDELDSMIAASRLTMNNSEKNICYSL